MLFAVGKRREYFYRIEMSMTPTRLSLRGVRPSRFINSFFEGLLPLPCGSGMQATLNPFRGFTPRPPVSNLGGIHTDATGFGSLASPKRSGVGVSPRGVQGRPLVWII